MCMSSVAKTRGGETQTETETGVDVEQTLFRGALFIRVPLIDWRNFAYFLLLFCAQ